MRRFLQSLTILFIVSCGSLYRSSGSPYQAAPPNEILEPIAPQSRAECEAFDRQLRARYEAIKKANLEASQRRSKECSGLVRTSEITACWKRHGGLGPFQINGSCGQTTHLWGDLRDAANQEQCAFEKMMTLPKACYSKVSAFLAEQERQKRALAEQQRIAEAEQKRRQDAAQQQRVEANRQQQQATEIQRQRVEQERLESERRSQQRSEAIASATATLGDMLGALGTRSTANASSSPTPATLEAAPRDLVSPGRTSDEAASERERIARDFSPMISVDIPEILKYGLSRTGVAGEAIVESYEKATEIVGIVESARSFPSLWSKFSAGDPDAVLDVVGGTSTRVLGAAGNPIQAEIFSRSVATVRNVVTHQMQDLDRLSTQFWNSTAGTSSPSSFKSAYQLPYVYMSESVMNVPAAAGCMDPVGTGVPRIRGEREPDCPPQPEESPQIVDLDEFAPSER